MALWVAPPCRKVLTISQKADFRFLDVSDFVLCPSVMLGTQKVSSRYLLN